MKHSMPTLLLIAALISIGQAEASSQGKNLTLRQVSAMRPQANYS
jgi:hypothetical protein